MTEHMIVLSPASSPHHTEDSVVIDADCGHRAWIAPTGMTTVLSPFIQTRTVCIRCVPVEELRKARDRGDLRAIPGAKEELAAELGTDVADQLYRDMGVNEEPL